MEHESEVVQIYNPIRDVYPDLTADALRKVNLGKVHRGFSKSLIQLKTGKAGLYQYDGGPDLKEWLQEIQKLSKVAELKVAFMMNEPPNIRGTREGNKPVYYVDEVEEQLLETSLLPMATRSIPDSVQVEVEDNDKRLEAEREDSEESDISDHQRRLYETRVEYYYSAADSFCDLVELTLKGSAKRQFTRIAESIGLPSQIRSIISDPSMRNGPIVLRKFVKERQQMNHGLFVNPREKLEEAIDSTRYRGSVKEMIQRYLELNGRLVAFNVKYGFSNYSLLNRLQRKLPKEFRIHARNFYERVKGFRILAESTQYIGNEDQIPVPDLQTFQPELNEIEEIMFQQSILKRQSFSNNGRNNDKESKSTSGKDDKKKHSSHSISAMKGDAVAQSKRPCYEHLRNKHCKRGDNCKFKHYKSIAEVPEQFQKETKKALQVAIPYGKGKAENPTITVNSVRVSTVQVQTYKAAVGDPSEDDRRLTRSQRRKLVEEESKRGVEIRSEPNVKSIKKEDDSSTDESEDIDLPEGIYRVKEILSRRRIQTHPSKWEYRVSWVGYPGEDSWEPEEHIREGSDELRKEFDELPEYRNEGYLTKKDVQMPIISSMSARLDRSIPVLTEWFKEVFEYPEYRARNIDSFYKVNESMKEGGNVKCLTISGPVNKLLTREATLFKYRYQPFCELLAKVWKLFVQKNPFLADLDEQGKLLTSTVPRVNRKFTKESYTHVQDQLKVHKVVFVAHHHGRPPGVYTDGVLLPNFNELVKLFHQVKIESIFQYMALYGVIRIIELPTYSGTRETSNKSETPKRKYCNITTYPVEVSTEELPKANTAAMTGLAHTIYQRLEEQGVKFSNHTIKDMLEITGNKIASTTMLDSGCAFSVSSSTAGCVYVSKDFPNSEVLVLKAAADSSDKYVPFTAYGLKLHILRDTTNGKAVPLLVPTLICPSARCELLSLPQLLYKASGKRRQYPTVRDDPRDGFRLHYKNCVLPFVPQQEESCSPLSRPTLWTSPCEEYQMSSDEAISVQQFTVYKPTAEERNDLSLTSEEDRAIADIQSQQPTKSVRLKHVTMGHNNHKDFARVNEWAFNHGLSESDTKSANRVLDCEACMHGKGRRKDIKKTERSTDIAVTYEKNECILIDIESVKIKGLPPRGVMYFTDGNTRRRGTIIIQSKAYSATGFHLYCVSRGIRPGQVKMVICDNAKELRSYAFKRIVAYYGGVVNTISPYTPQQHGLSERGTGTLKNIARSIMSQAKAPDSAWFLAILHADTLVDMRPHSAKTTTDGRLRTPYECDTNRKPDLSKLKVWGCLCYVAVPKLKRKNTLLSAKSLAGIYVGNAMINDTWKVLLVNGQIIESRNVTFREWIRGFVTLYQVENPEEVMTLTPQSQDEMTEKDSLDETLQLKKHERLLIDDQGDVAVEDTHDERECSTIDYTSVLGRIYDQTASISADQIQDEMPLNLPSEQGNELAKGVNNNEFVHGIEYDADLDYPIDTSETHKPIVSPQEILSETIQEGEEEEKGYVMKQVKDVETIPGISDMSDTVDENKVLEEDTFTRRTRSGKVYSNVLQSQMVELVQTYCIEAHAIEIKSKAGINLPRSWKEMKRSDHSEGFIKACIAEINQVIDCGVLEPLLREPKENELVVGTMFAYDVKLESDGTMKAYKGRLVARGDQEERALRKILNMGRKDEYLQPDTLIINGKASTYAPTGTIASARLLMCIYVQWLKESASCKQKPMLSSIDFKNAFINAHLPEDYYQIVITTPEGWHETSPKKWRNYKHFKLRKALYGLKISARAWYLHLQKLLIESGFVKSKAEECTFMYSVNGNETYDIIVLVYVDDTVVVSKTPDNWKWFIETIQKEYKIKIQESMNWFLGVKVQVEENKGSVTLTQQSYIEAMLEKYSMNSIKLYNTPAEGKYITVPSISKEYNIKELEATTNVCGVDIDKEKYRSIVCSLIYLCQCTRPDIATIVSMLARVVSYPCPEDIKALVRVMGYLKRTKHLGIVYDMHKESKQQLTLKFFSDASFAQDLDSSRSRTGVVGLCFGAAVSWKSVLQSTVAGSTGESEYMAIYHAATTALSIREQLMEVLPYQQRIPIYVDNVASIVLATTEEVKTLMKHIRVKYHLVRQRHQLHEIEVVEEPTPTQEQTADIMTKNLPRESFEKHRLSVLGMAY